MKSSPGVTRPDVLIVGAGPAGLMAAIAAAEAGAAVAVCEHSDRPGRKLLASGGGRCNLTTSTEGRELYERYGRQGRFTAAAMETLPPTALRDWFAGAAVKTRCDESGRVFPCSNAANDVLSALLRKRRRLNVDLRLNTRITDLWIEQDRLRGVIADDLPLAAATVLVAAGGVSYPRLGATDDGYALARRAGHEIIPPLPALVGLVLRDRRFAACAGVSAPGVEVSLQAPGVRRRRTRGDLLFTHAGVSGPAVLDLSGDVSAALAAGGEAVLHVNLTPETNAHAWRSRLDHWRRDAGKKQLRTLLSEHLPRSVAGAILARCGGSESVQAAQTPAAVREGLPAALTDLSLTVAGTEGFDKAMVTRGGVALKGVDPRTLGSRHLAGLYFAGEVLDLDGPCGGYNLQWAFASGALAGAAAAEAAQISSMR